MTALEYARDDRQKDATDSFNPCNWNGSIPVFMTMMPIMEVTILPHQTPVQ